MNKLSLRSLVAALLAVVATAASAAEEDGVVRISDRAPTVIRGQSPDSGVQPASWGAGGAAYDGGHYGGGYYGDYCPPAHSGCFLERLRCHHWFAEQSAHFRARNQYYSSMLKSDAHACHREHLDWLRCKFGYFVPTGACGKGAPLVGCYSMVYPLNPYHFDGRDGQIYAAQGVGGPVSVPLAPVVHHAYNYGWGIPSSRLTPITHPVSGIPAP